MATVRLQLRSAKDATKEVPVYLVVEHKSKELLKYPTGVSVAPKHWNNEKKEVRKITGVEYNTHNQTFNGLLTRVNKAFAELTAENLPITGEAIRRVLDVHTNKEIKEDFQHDFLGFIQSEIKNLPNKINRTTGQRFSRQTLNKYQCLARVVGEVVGRRKMPIENIDMSFYYKFKGHLQDKGFQPNTIGSKYIAPLKTMLGEAETQGYKVNSAFHTKGYSVPSEDTMKVYLTETEINLIENLDLSKNERLERVRDVFLIGYYTGQRWGDYSKINKKQFEGNSIKLMQNKTSTRVVIPLIPKAAAILERYAWVLPSISQQNFNLYIKEVAQAAGINETVSHTRNIGSQRETVQYEKWQLVTTHTARRSFATNMHQSKLMTDLDIMRITGHKTEKSYRHYICTSNEEIAETMRDAMNGIKQPSLLMKVA